ncbi:MAG: Rrf2 family transcriptional regulator [Candidatus Eisenbacteria bacterium]|nr:Rrf2 family transcriptional regulator [Candidatus Eisenbacteria bacterium]
MMFLAEEPDRKATTARIANRFRFSAHHLAKVHQRLAKAGLLLPVRGPGGGVSLRKPPGEITLLEVYEAIEGPMPVCGCVFGKPVCGRKSCLFGGLLKGVNDTIREHFARTTLADLFEN